MEQQHVHNTKKLEIMLTDKLMCVYSVNEVYLKGLVEEV